MIFALHANVSLGRRKKDGADDILDAVELYYPSALETHLNLEPQVIMSNGND